MLARSERIPREFLQSPKGSRATFRFGVVVFPAFPHPAAAVVISKKTYRTATKRNQVRRRVHHIMQGLIRAGVVSRSVIIFPNARALAAPFSELKKEIENSVRPS